MKKGIKYLFYIGLIFFIILFRGYIEQLNRIHFDKAFSLNYLYVGVNFLISAGLGLLLGLKHLMNEASKAGKWQIDFMKLIIIGTPLLFISLYPIWLYGNIQLLRDLLVYGLDLMPIFSLSTSSGALFQLLFGYIFITSFYKSRINT